MRSIYLALFCLFPLAAAPQLPMLAQNAPGQLLQDSQHGAVPTGDEYEIWSGAIRDVVGTNKHRVAIVIRDETNVAGHMYALGTMLQTGTPEPRSKRGDEWRALKSELSAETIADFDQKNELSTLIESKFHIPLQTILMSHKDEVTLSDESPGIFWETFHRKYTGAMGLFTLSRVGFNSERTQAVVYIGYLSGKEGGDGRYVLLEKKEGAWVRRVSAIAWMS